MKEPSYSVNEELQDAILDGEDRGRTLERQRVLRLIDQTLTAAKRVTSVTTIRDLLLDLQEDVQLGRQQLPGTY